MPITRSRKSKRSSSKSKRSSMKSRHFNKRSNKTKKNKRVRFDFRYKGGVNTQTLQPLPNQVYSFPPGSTTSSNSSQNYLSNMSKQQADLNALHSGGGKRSSSKRSRSKRRGLHRYFRGGDYYSYGPQDPNSVSVSQFSTTGPNVSPMTANNSSVANNVTLISGKNNALNDCYADNSCPS
jgi:hypothetical protein